MTQFVTLLSMVVLSATGAGPAAHPREFWSNILSHDGRVPPGSNASELAHELSKLLASPDPALRDDVAYSLLADWIYRQKLLSLEDLRLLMREWTSNLKTGIGEVGTDRAALRSFSALSLSVPIALDNESPFLSRAEFEVTLKAALAYLHDEKDLRGYDPRLGWVHTCAHAADLLKFLARSRWLTAQEQAMLFDAIAQKLTAPTSHIYAFGEEERLARTALSLVRRPDFQMTALDSPLGTFQAAQGQLAHSKQMDLAKFAAVQNAKGFMRSLYAFAALSPPQMAVSAPVQKRLAQSLETLSPP